MPKKNIWIHLIDSTTRNYLRQMSVLPAVGTHIKLNDYTKGYLSEAYYQVSGYSVNPKDLTPIVNAERTTAPEVVLIIDDRSR